MSAHRSTNALAALLLASLGCGSAATDPPPGADAGLRRDLGSGVEDGGGEADSGVAPDLGLRADSGPQDASGADAALVDRGSESFDATPSDAFAEDAFEHDVGAVDVGAVDVGAVDAGVADSGALDAGFFTLTVRTSSGGRVLAPAYGVACDAAQSPCVAPLVPGLMVTLTASAAPDFAFERWRGHCTGTDAVVTVLADRNLSCEASFLGTAGQIQLIAPPASVIPNVTEHDSDIVVFREREDFVLPTDVSLDLHVPGRYVSDPSTPTTLRAGRAVDVYFLHFDPIGTSGRVARRGRLRFPREIIGLVTKTATLFSSDAVLGLTGTVAYPASGTHESREVELSSVQDTFVFQGDRRTLDVDFLTTTSADQIRIVTLPDDGPLPLIHSNGARVGAPPADVSRGRVESSTVALLFFEQTVTTTTAIVVDAALPATYDSVASLMPTTLPAGLRLSSVFVHFDPLGATTRRVIGSVTFTRPIAGMAIASDTLNSTNRVFGHPATSYPLSDTSRIAELGDDSVRVAEDQRSVRFSLRAGSGIDQLRVLLFD